jgi:chemotaxis protein MotD
LVDQITTALAASVAGRDRTVTVQLHPAELGSVRLTVHEEAGSLRGRLEVSSQSTLHDVRAEAATLLHRLNESGVPLHRIDVVLNQSGSSSAASYTPSDARGGLSQQAQEQGERQQTAGGAEPPAADSAARRPAQVDPQVAIEASSANPGGINVWI